MSPQFREDIKLKKEAGSSYFVIGSLSAISSAKNLSASYQYIVIVVILGVVAHDVVRGFLAFPLPRNKKQPGILVKNVPKSSEAIHGTQFAFTLSAPTTAVAAFTAVWTH